MDTIDTMDYLDTIKGSSTLHIKCDKRLHIGMKVEAMKTGKSMNQFVVDLMEAALRPESFAAKVAPRSSEPKKVPPVIKESFISKPIIPQPTPVKSEKVYEFCKHDQVKGFCRQGC